jgi:hypothetical protein
VKIASFNIDFLAAAVAAKERAGAALVASGDRDAFQLAEMARIRPERSGTDMASIRSRCRTSLRSAVILPTNCLALPGLDQNALRKWCGGTDRLMASLTQVSS